MKISPFQEMIESIEKLSTEDQDYLFDLIRKRRIEQRPIEITKNGEEILQQLKVKEGKAKIGTAQDLIADLLEEENEDSLE